VIALLMAACTGGPGSTIECVDNGNCLDGQACIEQICTDVDCLTSDDCSLENVCTEAYTCVPGCEDSDDCLAGFFCDAGQCAAEECEVSELDCAIGEVCNNGDCQDYPGQLCNTCTSDWDCGGGLCGVKDITETTCDPIWGGCNGNQACGGFYTGQTCSNASQCNVSAYGGCDTPTGQCYDYFCYEGACLPACNGANDTTSCPSGFECMSDGISWFCSGDCWAYDEYSK
jgi:hypothetical protein